MLRYAASTAVVTSTPKTSAPFEAARSANRPAPTPASSSRRPRYSSSLHPVAPHSASSDLDVPVSESSCTVRNQFHCFPKLLAYSPSGTNLGMPPRIGYSAWQDEQVSVPSRISRPVATAAWTARVALHAG